MTKCWRVVASFSMAVLCLVSISPAPGSETIILTYDALGRLIQVNRSGSINNGAQSTYNYDSAGNRTVTSVTTPSSTCAAVSFSVNDVAQYEGTPVVFTITKSGTAGGSCSVNYAAANNTAVTPNDYAAASGVRTFAANETTRTVSIATVIAGPNESTEYMRLNLSAATGGATISDSRGTGSIYNNFEGW
jgi:YD repeat-containing protein